MGGEGGPGREEGGERERKHEHWVFSRDRSLITGRGIKNGVGGGGGGESILTLRTGDGRGGGGRFSYVINDRSTTGVV